MSTERIYKALANCEQGLSDTEKAQARSNIGAQGALTAGNNITIEDGVISATDTTYSAGNGLTINGTEFSVDTTVIQPKLTAGQNVQINDNVISATDTTYTAGNNVQINGTTISATDTTYSAGSGLSLNGTTFSNTAPNVKSDWNAAVGSDAEILNKPTIPTVNDGTLTIQKNGTNVATFSANQSGNATANIAVPTDTGDLTNGAGFITASQVPAQVNADWNSSSGASEILNKPTIPTVNDGTLTIQRNGTQVATFSANQSGNATANISVPTDTGDLTNGAGFITASQIPSTDDIVLISINASTPYTDVAQAFTDGKTPVLYYGYQSTLQYYWFTSKTASSYTFAAVSKGVYGNVVTEYVVNDDNTITNSSQTSAKRFSVNDETLIVDNGELKWRYPATTYFGSASSNGGSVNWIPGMTSSQFNRKLVGIPLPAAGIYLVMYTGTGRFVDSLTNTGSPGMLFRVCIGDKTQSFSIFAGNWQFTDSSATSQYTGFSGFTIANIPQNYITDATLNISNNDYEPPSGASQSFYWTSLRAAWYRLPQ